MNVYLSKAFARLAVREGLTKYYLSLKPSEIKMALQCGELNKVNYNEKETEQYSIRRS